MAVLEGFWRLLASSEDQCVGSFTHHLGSFGGVYKVYDLFPASIWLNMLEFDQHKAICIYLLFRPTLIQ